MASAIPPSALVAASIIVGRSSWSASGWVESEPK